MATDGDVKKKDLVLASAIGFEGAYFPRVHFIVLLPYERMPFCTTSRPDATSIRQYSGVCLHRGLLTAPSVSTRPRAERAARAPGRHARGARSGHERGGDGARLGPTALPDGTQPQRQLRGRQPQRKIHRLGPDQLHGVQGEVRGRREVVGIVRVMVW